MNSLAKILHKKQAPEDRNSASAQCFMGLREKATGFIYHFLLHVFLQIYDICSFAVHVIVCDLKTFFRFDNTLENTSCVSFSIYV